jgi:hypothetical protein
MRALSPPLSFAPSLPLSSLARLLPHLVPAALTRPLRERVCGGGWVWGGRMCVHVSACSGILGQQLHYGGHDFFPEKHLSPFFKAASSNDRQVAVGPAVCRSVECLNEVSLY